MANLHEKSLQVEPELFITPGPSSPLSVEGSLGAGLPFMGLLSAAFEAAVAGSHPSCLAHRVTLCLVA